LANAALRDDSLDLQKELTGLVAALNPEIKEPTEMIDAWSSRHKTELDRSRKLLADIRATGNLDLSMLAVAFRQLRDVVNHARSSDDPPSRSHRTSDRPISALTSGPELQLQITSNSSRR
jgi:hypothetical protein